MRLLFSLFTGFGKTLRYWRAVVLLVLLQLFLGWLLAFPLSSAAHEVWDHSMIGAELNDGRFLPAIAMDELLIHADGPMTLTYRAPFMFALGGAYLIISILIIAGLLPLYSGLDLKFSWDRFWADAARYFRPFFGLAIIAFVFYFGADRLSNTVLDLVTRYVKDSDDEATVFISTVLFTSAFRFMLFSLIVLVFQYAKIISAAEQLRNVLYLVRRAFGFVARAFVQVMFLFALLSVLDLALAALDIAVWRYVLNDAPVVIRWGWLAFITILLTVVKLAFFACQSVFYTETRRRESEAGGIQLSRESFSSAEY